MYQCERAWYLHVRNRTVCAKVTRITLNHLITLLMMISLTIPLDMSYYVLTSRSEVQDLMLEVDECGNGELDFTEFATLVLKGLSLSLSLHIYVDTHVR